MYNIINLYFINCCLMDEYKHDTCYKVIADFKKKKIKNTLYNV